MSVHGLLLAAGAGSRMGRPKALVRDADGTSWLARAVTALRAGGCDGVTVVLGAASGEAAALLGEEPGCEGVSVVVAEDWASGMSASLRAGLAALPDGASAALVSLVDLPDVGAEVVGRLVAAHSGPDTLARATYDGRPGHPVLLGRAHWAPILAEVAGDSGARDYLAGREVTPVDCSDLATGRDVDAR